MSFTSDIGNDECQGDEPKANLPDERTESNLKNIIFRYLKNNVRFEGKPELVEQKIRQTTVEIYDMYVYFLLNN